MGEPETADFGSPLQLLATAELLRPYVEMLDPWPEDIEAPRTVLQKIRMELQTAHETVVLRTEADIGRSRKLVGKAGR